MMTYWIPNGPCMLPANASHQVGVGGFVINDKNEVLVVQEKHCAPELGGLWKLPTGFILEVYTYVQSSQSHTSDHANFLSFN